MSVETLIKRYGEDEIFRKIVDVIVLGLTTPNYGMITIGEALRLATYISEGGVQNGAGGWVRELH